jgi:aminoglycoside phosphotransferase (APT) family kinase protein
MDAASARVTYLDAGIMNYVYRVDVSGRTLFLKQALEKVKQHDRLGPDLAGVSPARIQAEGRALRLLSEHLPPEYRMRVPDVAWYDAENNVLWTHEIAPGSTPLQKLLEEGRFDTQAAQSMGRLLGAIHSAGSGEAPPLWPSRDEDEANWQRFLRMRTVGVLVRADLPVGAEALTRELHDAGAAVARSGMVSHLDAAPKNVLVGDAGEVALLDFELGAAISDPAYDPAFLAGHYLLMGANREGAWEEAVEAAHAVAQGYRETAPEAAPEWYARFTRYAALAMLYRVYGSSPAPYLDPARYSAIRRAALQVLNAGHL